MESLNQRPRFCYNPGDVEEEVEFSAILEVFVHHARNIHNICIYDNQDVYAKFSLTYNPDEITPTRVVIGGGKNPKFDEKLELKVHQNDAILKCEIWMQSRARNLLEDQLLGFTLVPISLIASQGGKIKCQDFSLSSTDLFHSPAGTVQLSLSLSSTTTSSPVSDPLNSSVLPFFSNISLNSSSINSEVILLGPSDYSRVEFPDINAAAEDQMMVSELFSSNSSSIGSFLHLGSVLKTGDDDYEMVGNSSEENENSPILSSITTTMSDDRNTADSNSIQSSSTGDQNAPPKPAEERVKQLKEIDHLELEDERGERNCGENGGGGTEMGSGQGDLGRAFSGRVASKDLEAEQAAMQQQIVDMYMKSMQQFTESLAKMKLPMDLDPNPVDEDPSNVIKVMDKSTNLDVENKKDGSRVFYGSRAFF